MPSVSATVTSCLLKQPETDTAHSSAAGMTRRRLMARMLDAGHGRARAAIVVLLVDRLEPLERLAPTSLEPAPLPEHLHQAVRRELGVDLRRVLDLRAISRGCERPRGVRLIAVELPAPAHGDDAEGPLDVDEGHVGP